ncbi:MAG: NAD(P)-dependent oxidoreductase, partial [Cellulomonas sp.]
MKQVSEMTVVVVGMGNIGRGVASRFAALGDRVVGVNREQIEVDGVAEIVMPEGLAEAVGRADAIVNTLPGTEGTYTMISRDVLAGVKPGVIVASVGRGNVIDQEALVEALTDE